MFYFRISTQTKKGQLKLIARIWERKSSLISNIGWQQYFAHLMFKGPKNIFYLQGVIFAAQISAQKKKGQCKVIAISLAQLLGGNRIPLSNKQRRSAISLETERRISLQREIQKLLNRMSTALMTRESTCNRNLSRG